MTIMIQNILTHLGSWLTGENTAIVLFFIGVYGIIAHKHIIKSIISLGIMQAALILFFVTIKAGPESVPPIGGEFAVLPADPLPQALMITAVVVGMAVTAVSLTVFITLYHKYGSSDWQEIQAKRRDIE